MEKLNLKPFKKVKLRDFDFKLVLMVVALMAIGVLAVGSAESSLQLKQLIGAVGGLVLMLFLAFLDYHFVLQFYWVIYALNMGLLILVFLAGDSGGGAQRWFEIGSFRFQPSELAKILLILFFAQFIMKLKEHLNTMLSIVACIILIGAPLALIYMQPDLSTSVIVVLVFCVIMFSGKTSWKVILGVLAVVIPAIVIVLALALQPDSDYLENYQKNRILAWINPDEYTDSEAYQQINSVTAIASGQLDGKGYKNNQITSVKNGNFLSEDQTDFIFAVIGEEFGFKGSIVVVILLFLVALECISIGRRAPDTGGAIIASSMGGLIGFQGFVNIGVATFLLPNTGLPLPFVSYGLTSLISLCIGIGFVLNVRFQVKRDRLPVDDIFE